MPINCASHASLFGRFPYNVMRAAIRGVGDAAGADPGAGASAKHQDASRPRSQSSEAQWCSVLRCAAPMTWPRGRVRFLRPAIRIELAALTVPKAETSPQAQAPQLGLDDTASTGSGKAGPGRAASTLTAGAAHTRAAQVFEARLPELSAAGQSAAGLLMHARQAPSLRETQLVLA